MKRSFIILAAVMLVACAALAPALAQTIPLSSNNSTATIDLTQSSYPGGGVVSWNLDGTFIQYQNQFFVGAGTTGATPMAALPSTLITQTANQATVTYTGTGFTGQATYSLLGGSPGSHTGDLDESFLLTNTGSSARTFRVYFYSDFDLGNVAANDTARISGTAFNTVAVQTGNSYPNILAVTSLNPNASEVEANTYSNTLTSLLGATAYILNGSTTATGDATWAVEYDVTLAPTGSFAMSLDERISQVPLPPSALLLGTGLLGLVGLRRFRKS